MPKIRRFQSISVAVALVDGDEREHIVAVATDGTAWAQDRYGAWQRIHDLPQPVKRRRKVVHVTD